MHRTKLERRKDDIIGEAVLLILKDNGPVNFASLAARLKVMAGYELDPERQVALAAASVEIELRISELARNRTKETGNFSTNSNEQVMLNHGMLNSAKKH